MRAFDEVTMWTESAPGTFTGEVTPDWMQGRAAFGGLLTAGCVRLGLAAVPNQPLRSVDARFFEPVGIGALEARLEVLRSGRSVTHVQVEVWQGERRCMRATLCLVAARPSKLAVPPALAPDLGPPEALMEVPYLEGLTPAFTRHIDMRFRRGIPFTGSAAAEIDGWCRFREGATGSASVVGLVDAWPAPLLTMGRQPFPASTVHWTVHWLASGDVDPTAWFQYRARTLQAGDGNTTFEASLWDADGQPVAWAEQLAVVFDERRSRGQDDRGES